MQFLCFAWVEPVDTYIIRAINEIYRHISKGNFYPTSHFGKIIVKIAIYIYVQGCRKLWGHSGHGLG